MIDFLSWYVHDALHLDGILARLVLSFILASIVLLSVIIIGWLVNRFEFLQMRFLSKFFSQKTVFVLCNYCTFIGVFFHELSHAFAAWATGAKVVKVKLFQIKRDSDQLGCVEFCPKGSKLQRSCQMALVSCAPVLTGMFFSYIIIRLLFFHQLDIWINILLWYVLISIVDHMSMSVADIKNYLKGMLFLFPCMIVICWFFIYFFMR